MRYRFWFMSNERVFPDHGESFAGRSQLRFTNFEDIQNDKEAMEEVERTIRDHTLEIGNKKYPAKPVSLVRIDEVVIKSW